MPLETGTTLNALNASWPLSGDSLSVQDDHTRLIKSILKSTFGNNPSPRVFTQDFSFQNVNIGGFVGQSPQVLKAGGQINGADGSIRGESIGISNSQRIEEGIFEVQLTENGWNFQDLIFFENTDYLLGLGKSLMQQAVTNTDGTWVRIVSVPLLDAGTPTDPLTIGFGILDMGRA